MAKKIIVWTETAAKQRRDILAYWTKRNHSIAYAKKLIRLINKQTKIILNHPESFKESIHPNTRESALGHFSLFYRMEHDRLIILSIWDNRQDPQKLLQALKN